MAPSVEQQARSNHLCICGVEKGIGKLTCWTCYYEPIGYQGYKEYPGSFEQWLKYRLFGFVNTEGRNAD